MPENFIPLKNTKHELPANARALGAAGANEVVRVSIYVRPNPQSDLGQEVKGRVIGRQAPMSREEYRNVHGTDPKDMERVKKYYEQQGLKLVEESQSRHVLVFRGSVGKVSEVFKTPLHRFEQDLPERGRISYRANVEDISIPRDLQEIITGVFGLDERPAARPYFKRHRSRPRNTYTPLELAKRYNFPNGLNGSGQTIALIELGGGYYPADLESYFSDLGISPIPVVNSISVDGASNMPGISPDDGEVELDIEVAGAIASGATIVVYFAPNTFAGYLDAVTTAIHDSTNNPSVISISWGGPENPSLQTWVTQMDHAFQAAAALGITVCVAAGDQGSTDGLNDGQQHADFPASSPHVLACGGTSLNSGESVWNDGPASATGGGISTFFQHPDWQQGLSALTSSNTQVPLDMRGLPDVAGNADPNTGYWVCIDGQFMVEGGTSAVAPLWAGLIALFNQHLGTSVGYLNPVIYHMEINQGQAFSDIVQGNNGYYQAAHGWDACTGWGSPNGTQLLSQLSSLAAQAIPAAGQVRLSGRDGSGAISRELVARRSMVSRTLPSELEEEVKMLVEEYMNQFQFKDEEPAGRSRKTSASRKAPSSQYNLEEEVRMLVEDYLNQQRSKESERTGEGKSRQRNS